MEANAVSPATTGSRCQLAFFPAAFDITETRHPNGSDLDNWHRFGARARHAGDSPTAVCTADIRALARSLRSKLQARVYQAWIFYRKASAWGSSEIAARSPGLVVVGAVVAPAERELFRLSCLPMGIRARAGSGGRIIARYACPCWPSRCSSRGLSGTLRLCTQGGDFATVQVHCNQVTRQPGRGRAGRVEPRSPGRKVRKPPSGDLQVREARTRGISSYAPRTVSAVKAI